MTTFVSAFSALKDSLPESVCTLRIETKIYTDAICSGFDAVRAHDEYATIDEEGATVRMIAANEDGRYPLKLGSVAEIKVYGSDEYSNVRITGRKNTGGILVLTIVNEHE